MSFPEERIIITIIDNPKTPSQTIIVKKIKEKNKLINSIFKEKNKFKKIDKDKNSNLNKMYKKCLKETI